MSETKWTAQGAGVYEDGKLIGCFGDDGDEEEGREQVARARMAAAAPELYEALTIARQYMNGPAFETLSKNRALVDAALARARGE